MNSHIRHAGGEKVVIGWSESVEFPDWRLGSMRAKIDTGARTSALHVEDVEELSGNRVRFHVMVGRKTLRRRRLVTARVVRCSRVRSSNGHHEERYFVSTRIRLGGVEKAIEISLVSREKMLFRMLLGRTALEHDFLVDVSHRHRVSRPPARKTKLKKKVTS